MSYHNNSNSNNVNINKNCNNNKHLRWLWARIVLESKQFIKQKMKNICFYILNLPYFWRHPCRREATYSKNGLDLLEIYITLLARYSCKRSYKIDCMPFNVSNIWTFVWNDITTTPKQREKQALNRVLLLCTTRSRFVRRATLGSSKKVWIRQVSNLNHLISCN